MNKNSFFLILIALGFVFAAGPGHARYHSDAPVTVTVISENGREYNQFPQSSHNKQYRAYLEAKKHQNYKIRLKNNTNKRVGVVVTVDGRNIITGARSELARNERMVILKPYQRTTLKGWQTAKNRANRFFFTNSTNSYADAWNDHSAMGVIATAVYFEQKPAYKHHSKPQKRLYKKQMQKRSEPGTGFGSEVNAPSKTVYFNPSREPIFHSFIKYEWRRSLVRMGIIKPKPRRVGTSNRFWSYDNNHYAPYPPGRSHYYSY